MTYAYDKVSDVTNISDGVNAGGASAAFSGVTYDDLYRVVSLNSTARGTETYAYNAIGNILTNSDFGSGAYVYGAKPHAVISANGVSYGYDACGNMTTRGNQTLIYDCENHLVKVSTTNDAVAFGYGGDGERLWRAGTNGYSVWIGGIYEINDGKVLCHVIAGGQLVCTFEPLCGGMWSKVMGEKNWYVASTTLDNVFNWPFQQGRAGWTFFGATWACILGTCLVAGRGIRLRRFEVRKTLRAASLWRGAVTITLISAFLGAGAANANAAVTYSPVFYYYHPDHLGSSNVLTDRSGYIVQHYEYSTFGSVSYQNNTLAYPVSNRYTGQIADDETGLYYYGGRYYDPQLGRFTQPDPTVPDPSDSQSLNRYSYCRNNPLNATDPSGYDDDLGGADAGASDPDVGSAGSLSDPTDGDVGDNSADGTSGSLGYSYSSQSSTNFLTGDYTNSYAFYNGSMYIVGEEEGNIYTGESSQTTMATDGANFYGESSETEPVGTSADSPSLTVGNADTDALSRFPTASPQDTENPSSASTESGGGGWLAGLTNAAGLVAMLPIPEVAAAAGLVNAVGEAAQGHWVAAGIGAGTAVLAVFGLGAFGRIAESVLSDEALVVKGGKNIRLDTFDEPIIGRIHGTSASSETGKTVEELSQAIPHGQIRVTTVGAIRKAGGDVLPTLRSANNPYHVTITGLNENEINSILSKPMPNPAKQ